MSNLLTKSKYLTGLQCHKYLWISFNDKSKIPPTDPATQFVFDQGHEEGDEASRTFVNTFIKGQDAKNKDAIRKDLEDYCRLDTQAMADVVKKLNEITQR